MRTVKDWLADDVVRCEPLSGVAQGKKSAGIPFTLYVLPIAYA
jgi:hypothetical protein